jgi:hypothetical protein
VRPYTLTFLEWLATRRVASRLVSHSRSHSFEDYLDGGAVREALAFAGRT